MTALKDIYDAYFDVVRAGSLPLLDKVYALRYQVYCVENPFEPIAENPNERETDQYDAHSLHSLLVHRQSGIPVGTVRLILPEHHRQQIDLPIRHLCIDDLWTEISGLVPLRRTAEISRFAIAKEFRRRAEDRGSIAGGLTEPGDPRRMIPQISLGLMRAIVEMAASASLTHLFAVMEPALLRMLQRLGIHFDNLGPIVNYHGRRQPCYCELDRLLARTARERREVWEIITNTGLLWPLPEASLPIGAA
jgi:N-acyl amino acid synthase of PEP-CTERM/exosortase system